MQVSTRFTMAMHTLLCIGYFSGKVKTTSAFLASSVNANPVVIRRVLGQLKEAGIVTVEPGVGGASLTKDPADVTMRDVFRAVDSLEGGHLFDFHANPNPQCPVGAHVHDLLDSELVDAQAALERRLSQTTLADLLDRLRQETEG
ncbi:Rrf2 family transcriptional regulator [Bifidobacterium pullorum subsp. saeculare]|uniref:Rrf2 family transcriptional regulator n=1 Tax=Bifidobacterium pullorum subsp. saeculare TaxID=78257 RepID=A0A938WYR5_9BIFI|nr:Rrf2 family transcriptional regulator [Bifidobacterium pullorum]MBM6700331.1 Rrf2 family transcriptional regulator [Bifidobacterium pullorum subsp. saeculare]